MSWRHLSFLSMYWLKPRTLRRWSTPSTSNSVTMAALMSMSATPTPSIAILPETFAPAPVAKHLRKKFPNGNFLPAHSSPPATATSPKWATARPNVPAPQGLKVVLDEHGKPRHSVRGIIVHRKHLYVADEAGDAVKVFEVKTGRLVARIKGRKLTKPVHLILHGTRFTSVRRAAAAFSPSTSRSKDRGASSRRARSSTAS